MNNNLKEILFFTARVLLYALVMVLLNLVFTYDAGHETNTGKFGENSLTEWLQEGFLLISGFIFLFVSRSNRELSAIARLIALFFFMSFIREFNNQISFWFYLELPLIFVVCWLLYHDRKQLVSSVIAFIKNPAIPWFVIGFLVTYVFSRLFGRTHFWENLLETNYIRWAKNAAEEGIELLGYALLLIAGIEYFIGSVRTPRDQAR